MPMPTAYRTATFQLVLDGTPCGFLKSIDGGSAVAEVISETVGSSHFAKKHIGQVAYTPLVMEFGIAMARTVFDWVNAAWIGDAKPMQGAITTHDSGGTAVSRLDFTDALVTAFSVPPMDATSKDAAHFTLKLAPELTRPGKASGQAPAPDSRQKRWLPSNFRLEIEGVDCTRVMRIDGFTVTQAVIVEEVGGTRDYSATSGRPEFPNLSIAVAEAGAASWQKWFDDFVIKGNSADGKEKRGSIVLLSGDLKEELARIDLHNLGIFALAPERREANDDRVRALTARLYCERMELHLPGGAPKPVVTPRGRRQR